jgi:hypothetical protein
MNTPKRLIEVEENIAIALEARAAEQGLSVGELATSPDPPSTDEIVELDRRWAAIEAGEPTISNDVIVQWLRTWGSSAFEPWP